MFRMFAVPLRNGAQGALAGELVGDRPGIEVPDGVALDRVIPVGVGAVRALARAALRTDRRPYLSSFRFVADLLQLQGSVRGARHLELLGAGYGQGVHVDALARSREDRPDAVVPDHPIPDRATLELDGLGGRSDGDGLFARPAGLISPPLVCAAGVRDVVATARTKSAIAAESRIRASTCCSRPAPTVAERREEAFHCKARLTGRKTACTWCEDSHIPPDVVLLPNFRTWPGRRTSYERR